MYKLLSHLKEIPIELSPVSDPQQVPAINMRRVGNWRNAISPDQCEGLDTAPEPVSLVEVGGNGFLGVYDGNPNQIFQLLVSNSKGLNYTADSQEATFHLRRLLADSIVAGSNFSGILNPVMCLKYGEVVFFSVTNERYPVYDK